MESPGAHELFFENDNFTKNIYRSDTIPIKSPHFCQRKRKIKKIKFILSHKSFQIAKTTLYQIQNDAGINIPDSKIEYSVILIKNATGKKKT